MLVNVGPIARSIMKLRSLFIFLVLILLAVFLVINWTALSAPTTVNLIYTEMTAPLGVIVVAAFASLTLVLLFYTVWQQASLAFEVRAAYKEARQARAIADDADKSRVTALHAEMNERFDRLDAQLTARGDELITLIRQAVQDTQKRLDALERAQKDARAEEVASIREGLSALERKVLDELPKVKSAADVEAVAREKRAEEAAALDVADAKETQRKKELFGDLF